MLQCLGHAVIIFLPLSLGMDKNCRPAVEGPPGAAEAGSAHMHACVLWNGCYLKYICPTTTVSTSSPLTSGLKSPIPPQSPVRNT